MPAPQISAIVCTYNRYDTLPRALESLTVQTLPAAEFEVVVVDNSPDRELSLVQAARFENIANLKWVVEDTPGLSNARNVGIRIAAGPLVAFIDDDAIAAPDWLAKIVAAYDRFGPSAVGLGGRVDPLWGVPRPRWLHDDLLGYLSVVDWGGSARIAGTGEWVAGTNISFRREPLAAVGGFSVDLGRKGASYSLLSNDENEVIAKLKARGGQLIYDPEVIVSHLVAAERLTQTWFRRRAAWQAMSDYLLSPQRHFEQARRSWRAVQQFVNRLPARERSLRALCVALDDPQMFEAQVLAIHDYTLALLAEFNNLEV
jgi:glycosyltransferase involved in cell wall biosynthesis